MRNLLLVFIFMSAFTAFSDPIPRLRRGEGNQFDFAGPNMEFSVPHFGTVRALMVFIDFDNLKGAQNPRSPRSIARSLLGIKGNEIGVASFYQQQSFGKVNFKVDVDYGWMRSAKPKSDSFPGPHRPVQFIREALLLAQSRGHKMQRYDIVCIVAPKGMRHNSPTHYLSKNELKGVINPPRVYVTFGDDGQDSRIQHLVHETGHGMGLPDLYLYDREKMRAGLTPPGPWDIMGNNWTAVSFCAWNRHLFQWLDDDRKVFINEGREETISLFPIDAMHGISMVVLPTRHFPDEVIVVENPTPWKKGVRKGVMIYRVNSVIKTGNGPMDLELPDGVSRADSPNALWQPGQTYQSKADGISVEVLASKKGVYRIKVTNK